MIANSVGFTVQIFQKLLRFFERPFWLGAYETTSRVCSFDVGTVRGMHLLVKMSLVFNQFMILTGVHTTY